MEQWKVRSWRVRSWQNVIDGKFRRATTQKPRRIRVEDVIEAESRKDAIFQFCRRHPDEDPLINQGEYLHVYAWPDEPRQKKPKDPDGYTLLRPDEMDESGVITTRRKPGRPKKYRVGLDAARTKVISFRVSEDTYRLLSELGATESKSPHEVAAKLTESGLTMELLKRSNGD